MTRTRIIAIVLTAVLSAGLALAKPNFSGEWKMDAAKSDFGPMPAPDTLTMKIRHQEPAVDVEQHQVGAQGELKADYKYTTDGKECVNTVRNNELKSVVNWEGDALIVKTKLNFQGNDVTLDDKWTLAEDGKTMTIDRLINSPQGELTMKTVLVKQ
jgi:hypothetical protein